MVARVYNYNKLASTFWFFLWNFWQNLNFIWNHFPQLRANTSQGSQTVLASQALFLQKSVCVLKSKFKLRSISTPTSFCFALSFVLSLLKHFHVSVQKLSDSISLDLASCDYFQTTVLLKECCHVPSY